MFWGVLFAALAAVTPAPAASAFSDWAAIVVAGDWHAHDGGPSEVFDNARRDLAGELVGIGFSPGDIIVVSACFSGVFLPALEAPNRIVLTAAAPDRTSFGCGAADKYTFFDTCALQWLTKAGDFADFGKDVIACVESREKKEKVDQPSNPQLFIGANAAGAMPRWK